MRLPRALILLVLACLLAVLGLKGGVEALLTVLPFFAVAVMLVSGHFFGEAKILRRHAAMVPVRRRRTMQVPRPQRARVRSVFARTVMTRRGPPAAALV
jgi:hypothetical protein